MFAGICNLVVRISLKGRARYFLGAMSNRIFVIIFLQLRTRRQIVRPNSYSILGVFCTPTELRGLTYLRRGPVLHAVLCRHAHSMIDYVYHM